MTLTLADIPPVPPRPSFLPRDFEAFIPSTKPRPTLPPLRLLLAALDLHEVMPTNAHVRPTRASCAAPGPVPWMRWCRGCAGAVARCHGLNPHEDDTARERRIRDLARQCPTCIALNQKEATAA